MNKLDVNGISFAHMTLMLSLHYLVKCRRRSLAIYNNEFILGSTCFTKENHCKTSKSLAHFSEIL